MTSKAADQAAPKIAMRSWRGRITFRAVVKWILIGAAALWAFFVLVLIGLRIRLAS